jgi:hypothetical protein
VPPGGGGEVVWQTPDTQGWPTSQGIPSAYQVQAWSPPQLAESVCSEHGSVGAMQLQGGQGPSGGQGAQAQAEVGLLEPPSVGAGMPGLAIPLAAVQAQSQGGTVPSALAMAGQAHAQVPP